MGGRYYVYELYYPMDVLSFGKNAGRVFYVGKGVNGRVDAHEARVRAILKRNRPMMLKHKDKVIIEIWDAGGQVGQRIVFRSDNEEEAYEAEARLIEYYGIERLTNATFGRRKRTPTRVEKEASRSNGSTGPNHQAVHGANEAGGNEEVPGGRRRDAEIRVYGIPSGRPTRDSLRADAVGTPLGSERDISARSRSEHFNSWGGSPEEWFLTEYTPPQQPLILHAPEGKGQEESGR